MPPAELGEFIKRCALMRQSAQSRKAALTKEAEAHGAVKEKKTKKPKDSVALADELIKSLLS